MIILEPGLNASKSKSHYPVVYYSVTHRQVLQKSGPLYLVLSYQRQDSNFALMQISLFITKV
jgi:hypothetical protein